MTKHFLKTILISFLSSSLVMLHAQDTVPAEPIKNNNLLDSLTMSAVSMLATNLSSYKQTTDVALASAGGSSFISGDVLATSETKDLNKDTLEDFNSSKAAAMDQKQTDALIALRQSYQTAYDASNNKLTLQNAASASFAAAEVAALELATKEATQEAKCSSAIDTALTTVADAVNQKCTDMSNDPLKKNEAQACSDELAACVAKIKTDKSQFETYIKTRNTPIASVAGFKKVSELGDALVANLPGSSVVCSNYSKSVAAAEASGKCTDKIANDKKNESSGKLDGTPDSDLLGSMGLDSKSASSFITVAGKTISKDLDLNMLIPEHRAIIWEGMKELADSASVGTTAEVGKVQSILDKIDKMLKEMGKYSDGVSANGDGSDAKNGDLPWTDKQVKDYAATNPSVEDVKNKIAGLNPAQVANLYKIIGDNQADVTKLDNAKSALASSGGSIATGSGQFISQAELKAYFATGPTDAQLGAKAKELGLTPVQMVQARIIGLGLDPNRVSGEVTGTWYREAATALGIDNGSAQAPKTLYSLVKGSEVKASDLQGFFDSHPSDAQLLAKASDVGLGLSEFTCLMRTDGYETTPSWGGPNHAFGGPIDPQSVDTKYGSVYNRLDTSLHQGRDGYGRQQDEYGTEMAQGQIIKGAGYKEIKDAGGSSHWEPINKSQAIAKIPKLNGITLTKIVIAKTKSKTKSKNKTKFKINDLTLAHSLPCMTGKDLEACSSFSSGLNQTALKSMSSTVQDHIGNIAKLADSLNGAKKLTNETLDAARLVGAQKGAISSERDKLKTALQEKITANGREEDLDKNNSTFLAGMRAAVQSELDANKMTAAEMQASFSTIKKLKKKNK